MSQTTRVIPFHKRLELSFLIKITARNKITLEKLQRFTLSELSKFNGKNANPAYIAFKGKVYDVTGSSQWMDGDHLGHEAGQDLTMALDIAPHGEEKVEKMKVVGVLEESSRLI